MNIEEAYNKIKKERKLQTNFEELDNFFNITDVIKQEGFIPKYFERFINKRIMDLFNSWTSYLHGLVLPNPNSMINMTEHQMFSDEERNNIMNLLNKIMVISSENSLNNISEKKTNFIDNATEFWKKNYSPELEKILKKVNSEWQSK